MTARMVLMTVGYLAAGLLWWALAELLDADHLAAIIARIRRR